MSIAIATTPTFTLTFTQQDLNLTTARNVYVTFKQGLQTLTKTGEDLVVNEKSIEVYLSQDETISWRVGSIQIQANWTTASGSRFASEVATYDLSEQLLEKVVE